MRNSLRSLRSRILAGYSVWCGIAGEPDRNRGVVKLAYFALLMDGIVVEKEGSQRGSWQLATYYQKDRGIFTPSINL